MKAAILSFILALLCSCGAANKKPTVPTVDNEDVTDMLIWICFQHSDGTDAALEACGGEY